MEEKHRAKRMNSTQVLCLQQMLMLFQILSRFRFFSWLLCKVLTPPAKQSFHKLRG